MSGVNLWSPSPTRILCVTAGGISGLVDVGNVGKRFDEDGLAGEEDAWFVAVEAELECACVSIDGVKVARTATKAKRRILKACTLETDMIGAQNLVLPCSRMPRSYVARTKCTS